MLKRFGRDTHSAIDFGRSATAPMNAGAHVIVCGNEKGGSGKSTIAVHLIAALLREGCCVGTIDLDGRQRTLTRYLENRRRASLRYGDRISMPRHIRMEASPMTERGAAERHEIEELTAVLDDLCVGHDFVVVDTPGFDTNLSRAVHARADTLVTPMNDSYIDYDVLARIDPNADDGFVASQYGLRVREARRARLSRSARMLDWTVVRNRLAPISSGNERRVHESLRLLGTELGFRLVEGLAERVVYRDLFQSGLTVLDDPEIGAAEGVLGDGRRRSAWTRAADDLERLVASLNLGIGSRRSARAQAREAWLAQLARPPMLPQAYAR